VVPVAAAAAAAAAAVVAAVAAAAVAVVVAAAENALGFEIAERWVCSQTYRLTPAST